MFGGMDKTHHAFTHMDRARVLSFRRVLARMRMYHNRLSTHLHPPCFSSSSVIEIPTLLCFFQLSNSFSFSFACSLA